MLLTGLGDIRVLVGDIGVLGDIWVLWDVGVPATMRIVFGLERSQCLYIDQALVDTYTTKLAIL
jgi:hypothetical protein